MIVLDACVVIAHLAGDDAHHERATRLLASLAGQPKTMSMLTRAEVLVVPARAGRRRAAEDILDLLSIDTYELPRDAAGQLAELRAHTACGCRTAAYCSPRRSTARRNWPPSMSDSPGRLRSVASQSEQTADAPVAGPSPHSGHALW